MSDYAIGDVQGCYDPLMRLLDHIDFNDKQDQLWFAGDLVNRGPQSLEVLRFIKSLAKPAKITLGNHDLHLLSCLFTDNQSQAEDNIDTLLNAPDAFELGQWLRHQPLICYSPELSIVMCHAGIGPFWDLNLAIRLGAEVESMLASDDFIHFLKNMYGNYPAQWSDELRGIERLRVIVNYFTRMRFCDANGQLDFNFKTTVESASKNLYPWFSVPGRKNLGIDLVFGHWAALKGICPVPGLHAIDTGCVWGGTLTALRLQDRQRFSVTGQVSDQAVAPKG